MARTPTPWFWEERKGWYVNVNGQRHFLADHPENSPAPRKQRGKWNAPQSVMQKFHELMAKPPEAAPKSPSPPDGLTVAEVFDKYLDWCQKHRAARTYEWYRDHIQSFCDHLKVAATLPVPDLKKFHVVEWADAHAADWSPAYRRGAIIAIQRPFNWAEELGYISVTPIKKIPKPQPQRREQAIDPDTWAIIRDHYEEGDCFRDLLEVAWESGCRPQEVKRIESRHVDLGQRKVVFPASEAKGKKRMRTIYLTPRAEEIIRRRLRRDGVLFRNEDDRPWTNQAMSCRFGRLKKHLGGVKVAAYSIRHGFCERKLEEGHDHLTVAALMGHANGRMVATTYSHLNQAEDHLRKALTSDVNVAKAS